jgi:SAM-dependent methyltransferase
MKATRLIILESAILNPCNIQDLVFALESEIQMMKPEGFGGDIPLRLWENHANKYTLFENEKFLIKDSEDQRRQIYLKDKFNVLFGEERTKLTSKTNIANPPKGTIYFPIETQDKYKENRVVQCVDENIVHGFYEQSLLCTVFYMDLSKFPRNTAKILDIGAGLGDLSFNFYKLFKGGCEIYNIEKDKEIYEIGMKYFGYKDYDVEKRVTWIFEDYKTCVEKMAKFSELNTNKTKKLNEKKYGNKLNYFDLICMQMKEFNKKENTLPSKEFFEDSYLENIKNLLKPYGIYVVKLIANNFKAFHDNYKQLEKHFISIFTIPSEGGLAYIFFCFKDKIEIAEYQEKFKKNKEIIEKNNVIEFSVVKTFANTIFSQLEDMAEQKKKIEENSKRF